MKVKVHATGSTGNCVTIDDVIVIDAGVYVDTPAENLLITHHHTDHTKELAKYAAVPTFATAETIDKLRVKHPFHTFNVLDVDRPIELCTSRGRYLVRLIKLKHDAPCVGFDIELLSVTDNEDGVRRILYATDFNEILTPIFLGAYDEIYIECNNSLNVHNIVDVYFGDDIPKDEFHRRKSFGNHCNVDYLIDLFKREGYDVHNKFPKPVTLLHKSSYYYATNPERIVHLCKIANIVNPV